MGNKVVPPRDMLWVPPTHRPSVLERLLAAIRRKKPSIYHRSLAIHIRGAEPKSALDE